MIPLGQFRDTFIIAVDDEGVAIIDQHVAHERVLFERVMERLTAGRLESQRLLVPLVLEVAPSAHQALVARAKELERLGFELETFGTATIKVTAVPALLKSRTVPGDARLAEDLEGSNEVRSSRTPCNACGDHGVQCGGEGELSAHIREDAPIWTNCAQRVLDGVPARPAVMLRLTRRRLKKTSMI